jgi:hypothetical protein
VSCCILSCCVLSRQATLMRGRELPPACALACSRRQTEQNLRLAYLNKHPLAIGTDTQILRHFHQTRDPLVLSSGGLASLEGV